ASRRARREGRQGRRQGRRGRLRGRRGRLAGRRGVRRLAARPRGGGPRVRAGDYSLLDDVPMNYLPEDTQRAIGAEMAKDADQAAVDKGDHSMEEMAGLAGRYRS